MLSGKKIASAALGILLTMALNSCKSSKNCDCPTWGKATQAQKEVQL